MSSYHAYEVSGQRKFELVDRELVAPAAGQARLRVLSCGVCHTDAFSVEGLRPNPSEPVVPGHEIVGVIDALGDGVTGWTPGERVGVGYLGGHCGVCRWCRRGDFVNCENQPQTGQTVDGGYAEVVYARPTGLVRIPDALGSVDASPLLCAGLTTFNPLRQLDAEPDALVAIQGIGGLGISGSSTRRSSATASRRLREAPRKNLSQRNSARITTSTARRSIPRRRYRN